ncbi:MAG: ABC-type transport auxiliary lipoprotein family protein [Sulfurisoma sp.]|nr:ABC-type transport auxiliary lipoprotein family protein [Sulfurisoma sp.]
MGMMRGLCGLTLALLLAGCVPNTVRQGDMATFDFGDPLGGWPAPALRGVTVAAPSWLGTAAMQYRLDGSEPSRRRAFADSRWAAPPAELLEQALRRRALATDAGAALPCRLRVDLDEFVQAFDAAQSSRIVLAVRASLLCRDEQPAASRSFVVERPAGGDARSGVAAASLAVQDLSAKLAGWVAAEKSALATRRKE